MLRRRNQIKSAAFWDGTAEHAKRTFRYLTATKFKLYCFISSEFYIKN